MMFLCKKTRVCLFVLIGIVFAFSNYQFSVSAQVVCDSVSASSATKEELEKKLEQCKKEIEEVKQDETLTKKLGVSISEDIAILKARIKKEQLNIKAKNILINGLSSDIEVKSKEVRNLEQKIQRGLDSIADLLKKIDQIDSSSFAEVMLSDKDLSQFFIDIDSFDSIKNSLKSLLDEVREAKDFTEKQKEYLTVKKDEEMDTKMAIEAEKRKIEKHEKDKNELLSINKEKEKVYAQIIKDKEKKAAKIRSALFALRDTNGIPFEKALEYANLASAKTGVRPAFLLAVLQQESSLGKNVGACNRPQDTKKWNDIMPGPSEYQVYLQSGKSCKKSKTACSSRDDQTAFVDIMKGLGRDTSSVPLSCPIVSASPWGGAMGPAQFIPSTWQLFKERIASIVGKFLPDPWDPKDAIVASAIYLGDLGAGSKSYSAEKKAACKYYGSGGSSCSYGNQVMAKAQIIQEKMIDEL